MKIFVLFLLFFYYLYFVIFILFILFSLFIMLSLKYIIVAIINLALFFNFLFTLFRY